MRHSLVCFIRHYTEVTYGIFMCSANSLYSQNSSNRTPRKWIDKLINPVFDGFCSDKIRNFFDKTQDLMYIFVKTPRYSLMEDKVSNGNWGIERGSL